MNTALLIKRATQAIKSNSPEILTGLGAAGVVTTSYLSVKAGMATVRRLESDDPTAPFKEKAKKTWKLYIPPAAAGVATIGCIIVAGRGSSRRAAAAATAYSLTERAFSEYRDKVIEQIGENKEQKIRDELAQERINRNPPPESNQVVIVGPGQVLCCEAYTGRYFRSDMELLRKAQNEVNAEALRGLRASLSGFYYLVGLEPTSQSDYQGWDFEKIMELRFSSCLTPSGEPCLSFEYNYLKTF